MKSTQEFKDNRILAYLKDIVTIGVDINGQVILPTTGIPRQSALSPFFGALYLKPLDEAFKRCSGIYYRRYMDDIIILTETKRQYVKRGNVCLKY